jgi:phosphatidylglycerophosphate synthase
MLDGYARRLIDPPLALLAAQLARAGVSADAVTLAGLALGLACAGAVAFSATAAALVLLALSRLCDGLDGAVARARGRTDFGGFLDIVCDFAFYGAVPLGFAMLDAPRNALAAAALLFSFYVNGASFLAYAAVAAKRGMQTHSRGQKSLYFTAGLAEGTETIAVFVTVLVFPAAFAFLAWGFGALCLVTAASRVVLARANFSAPSAPQSD